MSRILSNQRMIPASIITAAVIAFLPTIASADIDFDNGGNGYSNELTLADGGLVSVGWTGSVKVAYTVTQLANSFRYEYAFYTAATPSLSHAIIETSQFADIFNLTLEGSPSTFEDLKTYAKYDPSIPNTKSNPGLPADLYGLKVPGAEVLTTHISFESTHRPMWGSVYATGGNQSNLAYLYNIGLPTALNDTQRYDYLGKIDVEGEDEWLYSRYVLVPDTEQVPLPGALLLGTLGLGAAGYGVNRKNRKRTA